MNNQPLKTSPVKQAPCVQQVKLHGRSAFTLIELLVVIAIIAILAAILFPVFARARENARRASCQSNLKQISLGIVQYKQDYDEYFVPVNINQGYVPSGGSTATKVAPYTKPFGWADAIYPYTKSIQILNCPSEALDQVATSNTNGFCDYFYNSRVGGTFGPNPNGGGNVAIGYQPKKDSQITNPSLTVMCGDAVASAANNLSEGNGFGVVAGSAAPVGLALISDVRGATLPSPPAEARHLGGYNFAFTDGHVKFYKASNRTQASGTVQNFFMTNMYNGKTSITADGGGIAPYSENNPTFAISNEDAKLTQ